MKRTRLIAAALTVILLLSVTAIAATPGSSCLNNTCSQSGGSDLRSLMLKKLGQNLVKECTTGNCQTSDCKSENCTTDDCTDNCIDNDCQGACTSDAAVLSCSAALKNCLSADLAACLNSYGLSDLTSCAQSGQSTSLPALRPEQKVGTDRTGPESSAAQENNATSANCDNAPLAAQVNSDGQKNVFTSVKGGSFSRLYSSLLEMLFGRLGIGCTPPATTPPVTTPPATTPPATTPPATTPPATTPPATTPPATTPPATTPPATTPPATTPPATTPPANDGQVVIPAGATSITTGGKSVYIGQDSSVVVSTLGNPNRTDKAGSVSWYVYNSSYSSFLMVGISEGKVVSFYTCAKDFVLNGSIRYGSSAQTVKGATLYADKIGGGIYAVLAGSAGSGSSTDALASEVFDITNAWRVSHDLKALAWDDAAAKGGLYHSGDMAQKNYFAHTSPSGQTGMDRYKMYSQASWRAWGENIAAGQPTAFSVMDGWINSAGHRANLLSTNFNYLGVGVVRGGSYGIYWTQFFIGR